MVLYQALFCQQPHFHQNVRADTDEIGAQTLLHFHQHSQIEAPVQHPGFDEVRLVAYAGADFIDDGLDACFRGCATFMEARGGVEGNHVVIGNPRFGNFR
jgi:hypothetical protein